VGDSVSTSNGTDPEVRRSTGAIRRSDAFGLIGSVIAAVSLAAWLMTQLQAFSGVLPFILVSYLLFLLFYVVVTRFDESALAVRDRLVAVFVHSLAIVLLIALGAVVIFTFVRGSDALFHGTFFITDMSRTGPLDPLTSGGILHAALGTLIMISMALAVSIPLGVATAVYLSEFPGRFARVVRTVVEAMTALPSIVAGLFIYATVILILGFPRSGFAAALAITVMMLPIIIRSADVVLRLVPSGLKEASQALGSSRWRTVWHLRQPQPLRRADDFLATGDLHLRALPGADDDLARLRQRGGADADGAHPLRRRAPDRRSRARRADRSTVATASRPVEVGRLPLPSARARDEAWPGHAPR
jgi:phosphate transport system permease protein